MGFLQNCETILCFGDVEAVAGENRVAVGESAVSATKKEAEETEVKDGLKYGGDGALVELHFRIAKDF